MKNTALFAAIASVTALVVGCANGEVDEDLASPDEASDSVETTSQALTGTCGSGSSWQCVGKPGNTYQSGGICWYSSSTGNCRWTCGGMQVGCR